MSWKGLLTCSTGGASSSWRSPRASSARSTDETALVLLTHVNFRTGAMHDMEAITAHCNAHGASVIWDLSHSAGAVPLALNRWGVEYAVGCTYKFLNGGPGATRIHLHGRGRYRGARAGGDRLVQPCQPVRLRGPLPPPRRASRNASSVPRRSSRLRAVMHGVAGFDGVDMDDAVRKSRRLSRTPDRPGGRAARGRGFRAGEPRASRRDAAARCR